MLGYLFVGPDPAAKSGDQCGCWPASGVPVDISLTLQHSSTGGNADGQLGLGTGVDVVSEPTLLPVRPANARHRSACFIRCDSCLNIGAAACSSRRTLCTIHHLRQHLFVMQATQRWAALAFGEAHGAGVTGAGRVFTWGANASGQLGQAPVGSSGRPEQLAVLRGLDVKALACGAEVGVPSHGGKMPRAVTGRISQQHNSWRDLLLLARPWCVVLAL